MRSGLLAVWVKPAPRVGVPCSSAQDGVIALGKAYDAFHLVSQKLSKSLPFKQFQRWSDWRWTLLILSRIVERFFFLLLSLPGDWWSGLPNSKRLVYTLGPRGLHSFRHAWTTAVLSFLVFLLPLSIVSVALRTMLLASYSKNVKLATSPLFQSLHWLPIPQRFQYM